MGSEVESPARLHAGGHGQYAALALWQQGLLLRVQDSLFHTSDSSLHAHCRAGTLRECHSGWLWQICSRSCPPSHQQQYTVGPSHQRKADLGAAACAQ